MARAGDVFSDTPRAASEIDEIAGFEAIKDLTVAGGAALGRVSVSSKVVSAIAAIGVMVFLNESLGKVEQAGRHAHAEARTSQLNNE